MSEAGSPRNLSACSARFTLLESVLLIGGSLVAVIHFTYRLTGELEHHTWTISERSMGQFLLPAVSRAAEVILALHDAWHGELWMALCRCVCGGSVTILLVSPVLVMIGVSRGLALGMLWETPTACLILFAAGLLPIVLRQVRSRLDGYFGLALLTTFLIVLLASFVGHAPDPQAGHETVRPGAWSSSYASSPPTSPIPEHFSSRPAA